MLSLRAEVDRHDRGHIRQPDPSRIRWRHRAVHGDVLDVKLCRRKAKRRACAAVSIHVTEATSHGPPWLGSLAS